MAQDPKAASPTRKPSTELRFSSQTLYKRFSLMLLALMVITLLPHYGKILNPDIDVSMTYIAHGILYLAWYVLFATQSHLSSSGHVALHKKLGFIGILLICALTYSGVAMLLGLMQGFDSHWSDAYLRSRTSLAWGTIHTFFWFLAFCLAGIVYRKRLHIHKRLMLMASLSMISASVTRIAFVPIIPINGTIVTLLSTYILLLVPVMIDRIAFGRVHPVLKWGVPVYIITQMLCVAIMPNTAVGKAIAFPFY